MSSNENSQDQYPPTVVPPGITDPLEQARAELKATLNAVGEKVNVPKRLGNAYEKFRVKAQFFEIEHPVATIVIVSGVSLAAGACAWLITRAKLSK